MIAEADEEVVIRPQRGPQERFLSSPADIVIYGGAAGGGKTWALLMEPLRHIGKSGFSAVAFRRTYPEIMNPGGLWDTAEMMYPALGARANLSDCSWIWPNGSLVKFAHMQHEKDKLGWQGSQVPLFLFDELTHFSEGQFFYMISRNRLGRSKLKVRPYIRATCNPDSCSWVAKFIAWWIDPLTGLAIQGRSGRVRWMARRGDEIVWGDSEEELIQQGLELPKSVTFIAAKITDNPILMTSDPGYMANLKTLSLIERSQLLDGNWKIRPTAGNFFKREWFRFVETGADIPEGGTTIRYWDRAATEPGPQNQDPDWTVGTKMRYVNGAFYILDVCRLRGRPDTVQRMMRACADADGPEVEVYAEQDPGSAGESEIMSLSRLFPDRVFKAKPVSKAKVVRAKPASSQVEQGNVYLLRAAWNDAFIEECENFADWDTVAVKPSVLPHDDQVDTLSGGVNALAEQVQLRIRSLE